MSTGTGPTAGASVPGGGSHGPRRCRDGAEGWPGGAALGRGRRGGARSAAGAGSARRGRRRPGD
eukprot:12847551-Alexandrium_andersonii.AAC.1